MTKRSFLQAADEWRERMRPQAEKVYQQLGDQVDVLIDDLGDPDEDVYDESYDLLRQMGEFVVPELLQALADPQLDPDVVDEVVSLLGLAGEERAREPIWRFLQAVQDDPERVLVASMALASLGDERGLPFLRQALESDEEDTVAGAVSGLTAIGELEDVERLRMVHRRHRADRQVRFGIAMAVLSILGEADQRTFERTLDDIRTRFSDRDLWDDIWTVLDSQFGEGRQSVH